MIPSPDIIYYLIGFVIFTHIKEIVSGLNWIINNMVDNKSSKIIISETLKNLNSRVDKLERDINEAWSKIRKG